MNRSIRVKATRITTARPPYSWEEGDEHPFTREGYTFHFYTVPTATLHNVENFAVHPQFIVNVEEIEIDIPLNEVVEKELDQLAVSKEKVFAEYKNQMYQLEQRRAELLALPNPEGDK